MFLCSGSTLPLGHRGVGLRSAAGAGLAEFAARAVCIDGTLQQPWPVRWVHCLRDGGGVVDEIPGQARNDGECAGGFRGRDRAGVLKMKLIF